VDVALAAGAAAAAATRPDALVDAPPGAWALAAAVAIAAYAALVSRPTRVH
jgi:hypothetical protein